MNLKILNNKYYECKLTNTVKVHILIHIVNGVKIKRNSKNLNIIR